MADRGAGGLAGPDAAGRARLFAAAGALLIAFSAILVKESHASDSTAAVFRCGYASLVLIPLALAEERRVGPRPWRARLAGLGAGVFFAGDLVMWDRSISDVGAGLATVLANVQVVIVPLVAWLLLRERPGARVLAGLAPTALGVLLISGLLERGAYGRAPGAGAALGAAAGTPTAGSCAPRSSPSPTSSPRPPTWPGARTAASPRCSSGGPDGT